MAHNRIHERWWYIWVSLVQIFSEFVYGLKYSHGIITHDCFLDGEQNIMGKGKFDIMLLKKKYLKTPETTFLLNRWNVFIQANHRS